MKKESSVVPSPCIQVCSYSTTPGAIYCVGCKRTSVEIREWREMTNDEKRAVYRRIEGGKGQQQTKRRS